MRNSQIDLTLNPALDGIQYHSKVEDHLERKVRKLTDEMNSINAEYKDNSYLLAEIKAKLAELNIDLTKDYKKTVEIDFTGSAVERILDDFYQKGLLENRNYKFELKKLVAFEKRLEGRADILRNESNQKFPLIEAFMQLMSSMVKIAQKFQESNEMLIRTINNPK